MNFNQLCLQACCKAVYHKHIHTTRHIILQSYIFFKQKQYFFTIKMFRNVKKSLAAPRTLTDNAIKRYIYIVNRKPKTAYYLHFTQCIDYFYAMQLNKIFNTRTVSQDKLY